MSLTSDLDPYDHVKSMYPALSKQPPKIAIGNQADICKNSADAIRSRSTFPPWAYAGRVGVCLI
jgi:hypothetical protein